MTNTPEPAPQREPGKLYVEDQVGPYVLQKRLGRGAMGEVWKAFGPLRPNGPSGIVALKLPRRPEFIRHLKREGVLLQEIDHPRVARVYQVELEGETPYIAMEYIDGTPLRHLCRGTMSSSDATLLCDQILEGLFAIHHSDILHLDLKPDNVLVDEDGQVKIVDLGLGKATSTLMAEVYLSASLISRELPLAGTLAYMAPEQRKGKEVDPRTDLYAFGVLLHELLSSKLPDPTLRLSQMRPDLPPRWDVVVAKLTHPDMMQRPSNAQDARQLVAFTLSEKFVVPVAKGGHTPRDVATFDLKSMEFVSPYSPGMLIGNYKLEEILGRGGFGEVWLATHNHEKVAIKLALSESAGKGLVREADIVSKISHPSIPRLVKDCTNQKPPHIVFELIEGTSLRLLLHEQEKLSVREAMPLFLQMSEAVAACHDVGVTHRDLKPEHFVVHQSDEDLTPQLRLIDFGLAGIINNKQLDHSLATGEGGGGTFDYMAPEQKENVGDEKSDVYALAVCFFEILSGSLPRGPQRLRMLVPKVPVELDQLVLQMLSRQPFERPSLGEVLLKLEEIFDGLPRGTEHVSSRKKTSWKEWEEYVWTAMLCLLATAAGLISALLIGSS